MKGLVRKARESDFQVIYDLQSSPFRGEVFDSPPVKFEEFSTGVLQGIRDGSEHYFVMEEAGAVTHFIWFQHSQDLWFTLLWGKWLRSLVYAAGVTGFRLLHFPRQHFWIRQKNRRMIKIAEDPGYGFVKMGEDAGYALRDEYPPLVIVHSNCYEIRSDVYYEREEYYRSHSLEISFDL